MRCPRMATTSLSGTDRVASFFTCTEYNHILRSKRLVYVGFSSWMTVLSQLIMRILFIAIKVFSLAINRRIKKTGLFIDLLQILAGL